MTKDNQASAEETMEKVRRLIKSMTNFMDEFDRKTLLGAYEQLHSELKQAREGMEVAREAMEEITTEPEGEDNYGDPCVGINVIKIAEQALAELPPKTDE